MLVALNHQAQLINLLECPVPMSKVNFTCPSCQAPVRLKQGQIVRAHFAHVSKEACSGYWENESAQHLSLKSSLYSWSKKEARVELEKVLPQIQQVADLLVEDKLVLEVQCSSLPISRLVERTKAYQGAGYRVFWLLGKQLWLGERLTDLQRQCLYFSQRLGFYLWEVDDEKKELRLRYLLHEDQHGKVQGLTKVFPFYEGSLLAVLRYPFQAPLTSFRGKVDANLRVYIAKQLYYREPKWMKLQEEAYLEGSNLLTKQVADFYPQIRLPQSVRGFVQIEQDVTEYYQDFEAYYQTVKNRQQQILYPPAFYRQKARKTIK